MINLSWTLQKLIDFTVNQKSNSSYFLIFDSIDSEDIKSEGVIKRRSADPTSMNTSNSTDSNATTLVALAQSSAAFKAFTVILILLIIAALVVVVNRQKIIYFPIFILKSLLFRLFTFTREFATKSAGNN